MQRRLPPANRCDGFSTFLSPGDDGRVVRDPAMFPPSPRASRRIARVEFRRTVRRLGSNTTQVVLLAVAALFFLALSAGAAVGAYAGGVALRTGGTGVPEFLGGGLVPGARGALGIAWLGLTGLVAARTVGAKGDVDDHEGLLLATDTGNVVGGFVALEATYYLAWGGVPLALVVAGLALGARAPLLLVTGAAVVPALLAAAVPLGFAIGLVVRHLAVTFEPIARHRRVLGLAAFLAYVGLLVTGRLGNAFALLFEPAQALPPGWLADLLLLGLPAAAPSPLRAGVAVLACGGLLAASLAAGTRVARVHWFADPHDPADEDEPGTTASRFGTGGSLAGLVARPTRAIATATLLRARRAPLTMIYVLWPLFGAVSAIQDVVQSGDVPTTLPYYMLLYLAWAVGAGLTLNPLGNLSAALPATLVSRASGRSFVAGHVLAGSLVGVPVAALVVGATAVASPLSLPVAAAVTAASVVAVVGACTLATGVGTLFPRFGTVQVAGDREAHAPSKLAMAVYSLVLVLGVAAGIGGSWAAGLATASDAVGVPAELLVGVAAGVVLVSLAVPVVAAVYAVRRFDGYRLD